MDPDARRCTTPTTARTAGNGIICKVNTDDKVIGVQYLVTTFFFFIAGGFLAMLFRAEIVQPGMQFFDTLSSNGLRVRSRFFLFVFIIPAFAGLANFAVPLMLGAPDMAFPRLNALSFWKQKIVGLWFLAGFLASGGAFATGSDLATRLLASEQPFGQVFFNMGVQWAGASSIAMAPLFSGDDDHDARARDDLLAD